MKDVHGGKKSNIRSFRYSDRVAEILEGMPGDSLNAKFENLVLSCYELLPQVRDVYEYYTKKARSEQEKLFRLRDCRQELEAAVSRVDQALALLDQSVGHVADALGPGKEG